MKQFELTPLDVAAFSVDSISEDTLHRDVAAARANKRRMKTQDRRTKSELQLAKVLPVEIEIDDSWHVITQGDIDSLSFLSHIVNHEPLDYVLFSTWCMAIEDVNQFEDWIDNGRIGRLDCYVGEIFPGQYSDAYKQLCIVAKKAGGRVAVFRNHAKVFAGINSRFAFVIESSANINTNPRCEQTAIHASSDLFYFFKQFFDGVISFTRDFDTWKLYETRTTTETNGA